MLFSRFKLPAWAYTDFPSACYSDPKLWRKKVALNAESLITAILNEEVLNKIRAVLLRERGCPLTHQEIQDAIERELLR